MWCADEIAILLMWCADEIVILLMWVKDGIVVLLAERLESAVGDIIRGENYVTGRVAATPREDRQRTS